jgi:hypothetical protein
VPTAGGSPAFRFSTDHEPEWVIRKEFIPSNNSAAVTSSTASPVRLAEADSLRQKIAVEIHGEFRSDYGGIAIKIEVDVRDYEAVEAMEARVVLA